MLCTLHIQLTKHQNYPRTGHTTWSLDEISFTNGPFLDSNITTTTFTPASAGVGSGVNVTASAITGINSGSGFLTTDVGRQMRIGVGYAEITARTSTTVVVVTITTAIANTTANADWSLGAFSDTTGHPSCVTFLNND
jgi:hypothetical protein